MGPFQSWLIVPNPVYMMHLRNTQKFSIFYFFPIKKGIFQLATTMKIKFEFNQSHLEILWLISRLGGGAWEAYTRDDLTLKS